MTVRVDASALRAALRQARKQRAEMLRSNPQAPDTAHLVLRPGVEPVLDVVLLRFPDSPYEGPPGIPHYRSLRELGVHLALLAQKPPPPPSVDPMSSQPHSFVAMWFAHLVPGAAAELIVEARRDELTGACVWQLFRAPLDGAPIAIGSEFDDAVFEREFGRSLTLAENWRPVLAAAHAGEWTVREVEPGYCIYAGPRDAAGLEEELVARSQRGGEWVRVALAVVDRSGLAALEPGISQWAPEHAAALRDGELVAGGLVDLASARTHLQAVLERRGLDWKEFANTRELFASTGEANWPVDPSLLARASVHLGRTLTETASSFVSLVATNLERVTVFLQALRAARPDVTVVVDRTMALATRSDGTRGEPIDLLTTPFHARPGTLEFDRETRFACDSLRAGADLARVCPCGAPARLVTRLVQWTVVEAARKRLGDSGPMILARWPVETPRAGLIVAVQCASHLRIPSVDELDRASLTGNALVERVLSGLPAASFQVVASLHDDGFGHRALIVHGAYAASIAMHDSLLAGVDLAVGRPFAGREVIVEAVPPDGLCVYQPDIDPALIDLVMQRLRQLGDAAGTSPPVALRWKANLATTPAGLFEVARPPASVDAVPGRAMELLTRSTAPVFRR